MAIQVLTNAQVLVNSVDLSNHVSKVTVNDSRDSIEVTSMGATNKAYTKGLGDAKITIDFFQDFAGGSVHATLQPLISSSTPVPVEVRPTNGARSTTNPAFYLAGALMMTYNGLDGSVGAAAAITAEFQNASQAGLTYPTS
jgi:hypothetical protein